MKIGQHLATLQRRVQWPFLRQSGRYRGIFATSCRSIQLDCAAAAAAAASSMTVTSTDCDVGSHLAELSSKENCHLFYEAQ